MDSATADHTRPAVAPQRELPSPAPSASTGLASALAKPASASPSRGLVPEASRTSAPVTESALAAVTAASTTATSASESLPVPASKQSPRTSATPGPGGHDSTATPGRAGAPISADHSATRDSVISRAVIEASPRLNGHKNNLEGDGDSELSEPTSTVHSPSGGGFAELEDEIVVSDRANGNEKSSPTGHASEHDEDMIDVDEQTSHYPKRKRTSVFHDLSESKMETVEALSDDKATGSPYTKPKPARNSLGGVKGVVLGYWRDSPAPDERSKHAVIGFIDVRDRLRTRIQPFNVLGESVANEYPLPPGPGGSWVTFERVVFSKHLVGLDHFQVKEYVRIRSDANEDTDEARKAAEKVAVKEAVRRMKMNPLAENSTNPPPIAYGPDMPEHLSTPRPDAKRRRVSGGFAAINPAPANGVSQDQSASQQPVHSHIPRSSIDPLPGTRPTRILLGYWKGSSEQDVKDRHAVYGILGQNDMFRVKLVRETRDGRFVDGNFPVGAGALWIPYEEVVFEDHLKPLARLEVKEYCRVRQWQLDHGETPEDRVSNETKAVYEAQTRAGTSYRTINPPIAPALPVIAPEPPAEMIDPNTGNAGFGGHELRQSRRTESRNEARPLRQAPPSDIEPRPSVSRTQSGDALERTNTLARREIARVEAAQGRADRHAANRERAAAAAADAAAAAAAAIPAVSSSVNGTNGTNGRMRFHESEEMQRLNKVWARQETLRVKAGAEDAKIYGGIKYERKANGPFVGKLVSQGTIISIDGEDYVEYRVLTKPSFF